MKDMESIMGRQGNVDTASDEDVEEGSSSDMDFGKLYICQKCLIDSRVLYCPY